MSASTPVSRRRFLTGAPAAAGLAAVAMACRRGTKPSATADLDLRDAVNAAGMEHVLVDTYKAATALALDGSLGAALPPVVFEFVALATGHHQQHLDAWNRYLTRAGRPAITSPTAGLKREVDTAVDRLTDVLAVAALALHLEDYASQSYLQALPGLTDADAVRTAAQILVVDEEHQAFLRFLLGLSPVGTGTTKDVKDFAPADPGLGLLAG